ncbi:COG4315 family predicted lipoprotein [Nonomuraea sp. bgisy101]|uniref:COG4315 family predicted lipoprotein n=1 Tax=Nonomuraea sp. bgisy101 TaxID=3413784 RepID=UPI003D743012
MRKLLAPAAAFLMITSCGGTAEHRASEQGAINPAMATPVAPATVHLASSSIGKILVDDEGMTLYLFEKDKNGTSACYDECAEEWPPYLTKGDPKAEQGAKPDLLTTVNRTDGGTQVVYGRWPLYHYHDDKKPGDLTGHDKKEFGAEWYAVNAQGHKAH